MMWQALFGLLPRITQQIAEARIAALQAEGEPERLAQQERVKTLEAKRDVMIAESGSRINAWMRAGIALPFVVYWWKLILWDKVLGLGTTDDLSPMLWNIGWSVIGFYLLDMTVRRFARH